RLTAEQGQAALGWVLNALENPNNSETLRSLLVGLAATMEQAPAVLERVLNAQENPNHSGQAQPSSFVALDLTAKQVQAALATLLDAIGKSNEPVELGSLAGALAELAPMLTPEQADAAVGLVLDAIRRTNNSNALGSLAQAA